MAIFTKSNMASIVVIFFVCLAISNFGLDQIPRGDGQGQRTTCNYLYSSVFKDTKPCNTSTLPTKEYGWPFVARQDFLNTSTHRVIESKYSSFHSSRDPDISLNAVLLLALSIAGYVFYKRRGSTVSLSGKSELNQIDEPIISSSDMLNEGTLTSIGKSVIAGYTYNLLSNSSGRVMILVALHGNTHLHLVATGKNSKISLPITQKIDGGLLKPVVLEGDFPEYFHVYCSPDKQVELREIFNPAVMAYLADFCIAYDLEIFDDYLYASQADTADDKSDNTTMATDVEKLLAKIGRDLDEYARSVPKVEAWNMNQAPNKK